MAVQPAASSIASAIWPVEGRFASVVKAVLLALLGSALLYASAKFKVPFYPVPMTMQSMVVLMIGAAFGARLGAATVILYLIEGALGFPVFADTPERGIGLAYMVGPTGGFLLGFVAAAFTTGLLVERGLARTATGMLIAMTAGHAVLFALGFGWLATLIGAEKAWLLGVLPFGAATLLKTALGAALMTGMSGLKQRFRPQKG
jgi:biotin transport system substrate-specific component